MANKAEMEKTFIQDTGEQKHEGTMAKNSEQKSETKELTEIIYERDANTDDMEGTAGTVTLVGEVNIHQTLHDNTGHKLSDLLKAKLSAVKECFIKTRSYDFVKETLEDQGHALICGPPGSGKTTLSLVLMDDFRRKHQHEVRFIRTLAESECLKNISEKTFTLVVFDDIFGHFAPTPSDVLSYQPLFEDLRDYFSPNEFSSPGGRPKYWLKVLFNTRTDVFRSVEPAITRFQYSVFKRSTVFDLNKDFPFDKEDKKKIITKHVSKSGIHLSPSEVDEIANTECNRLGFPYICQLFTQHRVYCKEPAVEFFRKPLVYFMSVIRELFYNEKKENRLQVAVLVLMVLNDGCIKIKDLEDSTKADILKVDRLERVIDRLPPAKQLQKSICKTYPSMIDTYLTSEGDILQFSHPTAFDVVAYIVGMENKAFILENCSLKFIVDKVTFEDHNDISSNEWNVSDLRIKLDDVYRQTFIDRLVTDTNEDTMPLVFSHHSLHDSHIFHALIDVLSERQMLERILHMKDKQNGRTFLFWTAYTGIWKTDFFKILNYSLDDFYHAELFEACLGASIVGNECVLEYIIHNTDGDFEDKLKQYTMDELTLGLGSIFPSHVTQPKLPRRHTVASDLLLHMACIHGQKGVVEKFLDMGVNVNKRGSLGMSALMYACYFDHLDVAIMLWENGADCSLKNEENDNCLHLAVGNKCFKSVRFLLEKAKMDPNVRGRFDRTPLMYAAYHNSVDLVKLLTENGAELEPKRTALNRENCFLEAAYLNSTDVVQFLLDDARVNIDLRGHTGRTALMMACRNGHIQTAKLLAQPNTNTGLTDYTGANIFHLAVGSGHLELVKWLKENFRDSFDVSTSNFKGVTPVMSAAKNGSKQMLNFLIEGVDVNQCDESGGTCLHYAFTSGNPEIVQTVLDLGLDLEKKAYKGRTPVMFACQYGNVESVSILKSAGATLQVKDKDGFTCLHLACKGGKKGIADMLIMEPCFENFTQDPSLMELACDGGNLEIVNLLLQNGLTLTPTCLHAACYRGHKTVIDKLLNRGANTSARDDWNKTPFMTACEGGSWNTVMMLWRREAQDVNDCDKYGNTCLHLAAKGNNPELLNWIIDKGAKVESLNQNDQTALHYACRYAASKTTEKLIILGCSVNQVDNRRMTPLLVSLLNVHPKTATVVEILQQNNADITIKDNKGESCLHIAARSNTHIHSAGWFLKAGMDINVLDNSGNSPIMFASRFGQEKMFNFLLENGADIHVTNANGATALHLACSEECASVTIIKKLIDLGLDLEKKAYKGRTPVMYACQFASVQTVSILKSKGANFEVKDKDGLGCFHLACMGGKKDILDILIMEPYFEKTVQEEDKTIMQLACDGGSLEIVNLLLQKGLTATTTRLHVACYRGHKTVINKLLECGANTKAKDGWNKTPFMAACVGGSWNTAVMLWERDTQDVNDHDKYGNTCLHLAAKGDNPELLNWIVDKGADLDTLNWFGQTALHFACRHGASNTMEQLITLGCSINQADSRGMTPLLVSLLNVHPKTATVVEILQENNADVTIKNNKGESCLHIAAKSNTHINIAGWFLEAGMDINVLDNCDNSPIMVASRLGQEKMFNFLLENGADIHIINANGATALHLACTEECASVTIIKKLIDLGLDANKRDRKSRVPFKYFPRHSERRDDILAALRNVPPSEIK